MEITALFDQNRDLAGHLIPLLTTQKYDNAHDLPHLLRVWQNVKKISNGEGGDLKILTAATLMHDCVYVPKDAADRTQASRRSAAVAATALAGLNWTDQNVNAVVHAIEAHSFSAEIAPETLEARILQDADRLDALGHIGIARCFAVSGALNRHLYDPLDPKAQTRSLDDTAYTIDHFSTKLLHLADHFQTETGRLLARERHAVLKAFYDGFLNEISGPDLAAT